MVLTQTCPISCIHDSLKTTTEFMVVTTNTFFPAQFYSFDVIKGCWKEDPESRPSFAELKPHLTTLFSRASFARDVAAIDSKLQSGDLNCSVGASKPSPITPAATKTEARNGSSKSTAIPCPVKAQAKDLDNTHTPEGYLKLIDSKKEEGLEDYVYVSTLPKEVEVAITLENTNNDGGQQAETRLTKAEDLVEEYDYISPALKQEEEEKQREKSPTPIPSTPATHINWEGGDSDYTDVLVTPNKSPQMRRNPQFSPTHIHVGEKGMKQSRSHNDIQKSESLQGSHSSAGFSPEAADDDSEYYNLRPARMGSAGDQFLPLPRSSDSKPKPAILPKPHLNKETVSQRPISNVL